MTPERPVKVPMRPALWRNGDKLYAIGGTCIEVPSDTTMETLANYVVHDPSTQLEVSQKDRWTVEGSNGNRYTVIKIGGKYKCSCPGFGFRKKCKHSKRIKEESEKAE